MDNIKILSANKKSLLAITQIYSQQKLVELINICLVSHSFNIDTSLYLDEEIVEVLVANYNCSQQITQLLALLNDFSIKIYSNKYLLIGNIKVEKCSFEKLKDSFDNCFLF